MAGAAAVATASERAPHNAPGSPDETEKMLPMTRQTSVLNRVMRGILTPLRIILTSGMPLPPHAGSTQMTGMDAMTTYTRPMAQKAVKEVPAAGGRGRCGAPSKQAAGR